MGENIGFKFTQQIFKKNDMGAIYSQLHIFCALEFVNNIDTVYSLNFTSTKKIMFLGMFTCLFVCLSVFAITLFIWGFMSISTLYVSYHDRYYSAQRKQ